MYISLDQRGEIILLVSSTGITSLLLPKGRKAHYSRFEITINVNEDLMCSIEPNSPMTNLTKRTKLIVI